MKKGKYKILFDDSLRLGSKKIGPTLYEFFCLNETTYYKEFPHIKTYHKYMNGVMRISLTKEYYNYIKVYQDFIPQVRRSEKLGWEVYRVGLFSIFIIGLYVFRKVPLYIMYKTVYQSPYALQLSVVLFFAILIVLSWLYLIHLIYEKVYSLGQVNDILYLFIRDKKIKETINKKIYSGEKNRGLYSYLEDVSFNVIQKTRLHYFAVILILILFVLGFHSWNGPSIKLTRLIIGENIGSDLLEYHDDVYGTTYNTIFTRFEYETTYESDIDSRFAYSLDGFMIENHIIVNGRDAFYIYNDEFKLVNQIIKDENRDHFVMGKIDDEFFHMTALKDEDGNINDSIIHIYDKYGKSVMNLELPYQHVIMITGVKTDTGYVFTGQKGMLNSDSRTGYIIEYSNSEYRSLELGESSLSMIGEMNGNYLIQSYDDALYLIDKSLNEVDKMIYPVQVHWAKGISNNYFIMDESDYSSYKNTYAVYDSEFNRIKEVKLGTFIGYNSSVFNTHKFEDGPIVVGNNINNVKTYNETLEEIDRGLIHKHAFDFDLFTFYDLLSKEDHVYLVSEDKVISYKKNEDFTRTFAYPGKNLELLAIPTIFTFVSLPLGIALVHVLTEEND